MCQEFRWMISVGSICGLIQSLIWMGLGIVASLTYLCVIPVAPYDNQNDFFRVTLVKLYFEGPQCIPDGSYLGQFNEEYRKVLDLFTPDRMFAVMIAYVILNAFYFILSLRLYLNRKNQDKRLLALSWSVLTLIICAVDVVLTYEIILDALDLKSHMSENRLNQMVSSARSNLGEVPYISLLVALISIRFVAFWLWNFIIGFILFVDALCYGKIVGKAPKREEKKHEEKPKEVVEEVKHPKEDHPSSVSLLNGKYTSAFDIRSNPDYLDFKKSMEAVTRFSNVPDSGSSQRENINRSWNYAPSDAYWHPSKANTSKEWEMTNEGYISDEPVSVEAERQFDFDHNLKNFESGQRKIKIVKPPIGKPVSIPVPPPLPTSGSCNC